MTNPKYNNVQGIISYKTPKAIPDTIDLAIIAIPAEFCIPAVEILAHEKNTRAFIVLSAGFSETNALGKKLEHELKELVNAIGGTLIGPNCIGVLTPNYHGIFTEPIPKLHASGCDFITGSGATASFIFEAGVPKGLSFSSLFSVGNSAQVTAEIVLKYMDETFDPEHSPKVKILYLEQIDNPDMLLKHASSL